MSQFLDQLKAFASEIDNHLHNLINEKINKNDEEEVNNADNENELEDLEENNNENKLEEGDDVSEDKIISIKVFVKAKYPKPE